MAKGKSKSHIPPAVPVFRAWKAHPDEYVLAGSVKYDNAELVSLDPAYLVPFHFRLEPKFISGFFVVPPLSTRERSELEGELRRPLRRRHLDGLNDAIGRFVAGVGLATRIPPWKEFASHLKKIVTKTEELIQLTIPTTDEAAPRGIMSASETMNHYLRYRGYQNNLRKLKELALEEYENAQALASKPGRRGDPSYRLFLESLVVTAKAAGDQLSLPGHEAKGRWGDRRSTPLSRFANVMIEVACERGLDAVEQSTLQVSEKHKAQSAFRKLRAKSYGAVLDQLETALEAMTGDDFDDRHPDETPQSSSGGK